jgi:hypothetical protein
MASADLAFSVIGICHILPSNPRPQSNTKPLLIGYKPGKTTLSQSLVGSGYPWVETYGYPRLFARRECHG